MCPPELSLLWPWGGGFGFPVHSASAQTSTGTPWSCPAPHGPKVASLPEGGNEFLQTALPSLPGNSTWRGREGVLQDTAAALQQRPTHGSTVPRPTSAARNMSQNSGSQQSTNRFSMILTRSPWGFFFFLFHMTIDVGDHKVCMEGQQVEGDRGAFKGLKCFLPS